MTTRARARAPHHPQEHRHPARGLPCSAAAAGGAFPAPRRPLGAGGEGQYLLTAPARCPRPPRPAPGGAAPASAPAGPGGAASGGAAAPDSCGGRRLRARPSRWRRGRAPARGRGGAALRSPAGGLRSAGGGQGRAGPGWPALGRGFTPLRPEYSRGEQAGVRPGQRRGGASGTCRGASRPTPRFSHSGFRASVELRVGAWEEKGKWRECESSAEALPCIAVPSLPG